MPSAPPRLVRIFFGRSPKRALYRAAAFGLLTGVICIYVVRPCRVKGRSMEPTFMDGKFNAITLLSYRNEAPQRGDIVAARMNSLDTRNFYLKRILGLPGERIAFEQGTLIIDGAPVPEPYVVHTGTWTTPPLQLGDDEFYIIGDNRGMAYELHLGGAIHRKHLVGGLLFQ